MPVSVNRQEDVRNMNSQVPNELISAYFDGETTPDERAAVERLLAASDDAQRELNEISKLSALLHSFPRETAPAQLATNVARQTSQLALPKPAPVSVNSSASRHRLRDLKVALASSLSAAALVLVVMKWQPSPVARPHLGNDATASRSDLNELKQVVASAPPQPGSPKAAATQQVESDTAKAEPSDPLIAATKPAAVVRHSSDASVENPSKLSSSVASSDERGSALRKRTLVGGPTSAESESVAPLDPSREEFVNNLRVGNLMQQVDPESNVAVVEFTVLDVPRGAGEVEACLIKNDIRPRTVNQKARVESAEKAAAKNGPEVVLIYVEAKGDLLAKTLFDVEQHPDLRVWSYQQPLQIESQVAESKMGDSEKAIQEQLKQKDADPMNAKKVASVDTEAEQVVNKFFSERNPQVAGTASSIDGFSGNDRGSRSANKADIAAQFGNSARLGNSGQRMAKIGNSESQRAVPSASAAADVKNETLGNNYISFSRRAADVLTNPLTNTLSNSPQQQNSYESAVSQQRGQGMPSRDTGLRNESSNRVKMLWVLNPAQPATTDPASPTGKSDQ